MKQWKFLVCLTLLFIIANTQITIAQETEASHKIVLKQKIKVFPNPATNIVNILGLKNSSQADIIVTDMSGNEVLNHQWAIRNNSLSIPIPNLNSGIYAVRINSKEQQIQTKFYKK